MRKGVIMEINNDLLTMLTPEGEFLKARKQDTHYEIGEEIDFFPVTVTAVETPKKKWFQLNKLRVALMSSAAAILFFITVIPQMMANPVYAYMTIDINPSFEIGLNNELKVVSLDALNNDGENILQEYPNWKNQHIDEVTEKIISKSREQGFLIDGQEVLITTILNEEKISEVSEKLAKEIQVISTTYKQKQIEITAVESDIETREKAQKQGVSTGRLLQLENKLPVKEKVEAPEDNTGEKPADDDDKKEIVKEEDKEADEKEAEKAISDAEKKLEKEIEKAVKEAEKAIEKDKKKDEILDKVKSNIENSNMPDHIKERLKNKLEEKRSKQKGKDKNDDNDDEDDDDRDRDEDDDKPGKGKGRDKDED
ncbi:anti-sigma factor domain-containing protein [Cytobacillus suaedae]|nr:anti-sigma factor domain-containing protein [Cytobacillus suaedae]